MSLLLFECENQREHSTQDFERDVSFHQEFATLQETSIGALPISSALDRAPTRAEGTRGRICHGDATMAGPPDLQAQSAEAGAARQAGSRLCFLLGKARGARAGKGEPSDFFPRKFQGARSPLRGEERAKPEMSVLGGSLVSGL